MRVSTKPIPAFLSLRSTIATEYNRIESEKIMTQAVIEALQRAQKLINSGKLDKAESLCKKVLKKNPHQPDALHLSGLIALRSNRYACAIQAYDKALKIRPNESAYHYNLGLVYLRTNQLDSAITHLQITIELQPELAYAYSDLCLALTRSGAIDAAIAAGENAVTLASDNAAAHNNLALAYDACGNFDASFEHYLKAARLLPGSPSVQFDMGNLYVSRGNFDAARQCFRKVLQLQPHNLVAYGNLVRITRYSATEHDDVIRLKAFLDQTQLSDNERTTVLFSLGKIYQDCELYDDAFSYFEHGNQLQDKKFRFDPSKPAHAASLLIDTCTSDLFRQKQLIGNTAETPVFIVGTPRSGTTLTEQVLSSHPDVFGAGELHWIPDTTNRLRDYLKSSTSYPQCLSELTENSINELASNYLNYTRSLAHGERRIVDKMPGNFLHLGFIHILFPNAKIIHCQRDPRDACISMFCTQFPSGVPYSYNLYKLGAFYSQYERTMEHWRKVLPADTMIEMEYETLVTNQETEICRLLGFLGLDWNDACLAFYDQKRPVHTASDTQVTKPLYSTSIGRWNNFQKHLQPLEEGLRYRKDSGSSER